MTPSEKTAHLAHDILASIRAGIDEGCVSKLIDEPIDAAAREFKCPDALAKSQAELLDHAAALLRHVHANAFPNGRQLTSASPRAEAVRLLESGFPNGFRGALLEATRPDGPGIPGIVSELCMLLSNQLRNSYVRWVIASHLERTDWPTQCQMASIILSEWGDWLPGNAAAGSADQFANFLPHVLLLDRSLRGHTLGAALAAGSAAL